MPDPRSEQPAVVVGAGVFERRRQILAELDAFRRAAHEVQSADLAGLFVSVPLSLLGWVGQVKEHHRWICQVHDPDDLRTCGRVGQADSEQEAIDGLTIHICHDHGGLPE
jgi:hypothetical protein